MGSNKSKAKALSDKLRYALYEQSVQDAPEQVRIFERFYREQVGGDPKVLREDFAGTFWISCEWIRAGDKREALAIDLSEPPLNYGRKNHLHALDASQKRRLRILQQDVREPVEAKADVAAACNFSFYCLKQRTDLVKYLRSVHGSLKPSGIAIFEMVGGPGFIRVPEKETRTYKYESGKKKGQKWFTYRWMQKSFDPVTRNGLYSIDFHMATGERYRDAFVYDWRVWTIPELRDCLSDAGFKRSVVYWEHDEPDESGEVYFPVERGMDDDDTWLCYVVAQRG